MKEQVTIYTKEYCPYCRNLKRFLLDKKIDFKEIEVSNRPQVHKQVIIKTGHTTVPAVFVGNQFIGGSEDYYEWYLKNA